MFIETSAKAGFNIKALFRKVASSLPDFDVSPALTKSNDLIDVKLNANPTEAADQQTGWCAC